MKRIQMVAVLVAAAIGVLLVGFLEPHKNASFRSSQILAPNESPISAERAAMFLRESKRIAEASFSSTPGASLGRRPTKQANTYVEPRSNTLSDQSLMAAPGKPGNSSRLARTKSVVPPFPPVSSPTLEQSQQISLTPLAFLNPPAEAGLSAEQSAALAQIGDDFVKNVGGPGQDPADPAYLQKWQTALSLADEQVWAVAGQGAYEALVNQRAQAAGNLPAGQ